MIAPTINTTSRIDSLPRPMEPPTLGMHADVPAEMPWELPHRSRVLVIRPCNPLWTPQSPAAIPPGCSLPMTADIATDLCLAMNRQCLTDPDLRNLWHIVIHRLTKGAFAVMRVQLAGQWNPADEFELPPDAHQLMQNGDCRRLAIQFNKRELRLGPSPQFWALHVRCLRTHQAVLALQEGGAA